MVGSTPSGFRGLTEERIYSDAGAFAPGIRQNLPVLMRLFRRRGEHARHFFFAPNPRTAMAARWAARVCRLPAVHTLCSLPASGVPIGPGLFADQNVVVSPWAQRRLADEGFDSVVIEPAVLPLQSTKKGRDTCRERFGDYVLFAGDLRLGGGVQAVIETMNYLPDGLSLVIACRTKTEADRARKDALEQQLSISGGRPVHVLGQIDWIGDLVSAAKAQFLPATDLTGKMDWPLVLLEGFAAGVPAVVAQASPIAELDSPVLGHAPVDDPKALAAELERVMGLDPAQSRALYEQRFTPKRLAEGYRQVYQRLGIG